MSGWERCFFFFSLSLFSLFLLTFKFLFVFVIFCCYSFICCMYFVFAKRELVKKPPLLTWQKQLVRLMSFIRLEKRSGELMSPSSTISWLPEASLSSELPLMNISRLADASQNTFFRLHFLCSCRSHRETSLIQLIEKCLEI